MTLELLTPHFSLAELTASETAARHGLDNTPPPEVVANLRRLAQVVLEPVEQVLGPVLVTSGYRSPEVNRLVGSHDRSQHPLGEAVDHTVRGLSVPALFEAYYYSGLPVDQVLLEYGRWVHVSHRAQGNRGQFLVVTRGAAGAPLYTPYRPRVRA